MVGVGCAIAIPVILAQWRISRADKDLIERHRLEAISEVSKIRTSLGVLENEIKWVGKCVDRLPCVKECPSDNKQ